MSLFPSLIEAVRRNKVRTNTGPLNFSTQQFAHLASLQPYDLGGFFVRGHEDDIGEQTFLEYNLEVAAEIAAGIPPLDNDDLAIEILWSVGGVVIPHIVPTPGRASLQASNRRQQVTAFAYYNGGWHLENIDVGTTVLVAKRIIEDAELNVEFVERPDVATESVNRGRAMANLAPIKTTRTISLSSIRKQYLGASGERGPGKGGTHARPVEHVRVLTRREITTKKGTTYVRQAKVIVVNPGIKRATKVVL